MKFLFLIDNPLQMQTNKDTSFAFMEEAQSRSHDIYYLPRGGISFEKEVSFCVLPTVVDRKKKDFIIFGKQKIFSAKQVDAIFIRLEPPFHTDYLQHTWLLDLAKKDCFIINDPQGVRNANEKLWALHFPELLPKTLVSRQKKNLFDFLEKQKTIIAKPLDGFGGSSIFKLTWKDTNTKVAIEVLSKNFTKEIMLQSYLPEAKNGDKRILLLDGEVLGSVLRVSQGKEHRNNFFTGGIAKKTIITKKDQAIVSKIAPFLKKEGLYFIGIDILGETLIEINVTSPTGIQEAGFFMQKNLCAPIIDFVEKKSQMT